MGKKKVRKVEDGRIVPFLLIVKSIALIGHALGLMFLISMIIPLVFGEFVALIPLGSVGGGVLVLSQCIYRLIPNHHVLNLQDTFITITFAWLIAIGFTGLVIWWIALLFNAKSTGDLQSFTNALFEAVSGSTSTGLTMVAYPERLPYTLQWIRTFIEWVGGLGLALFVFSFLHGSWSRYAIHESSTLPTIFQGSLQKTIQVVLGIYTSYTILIAVLFIIFGLDVWSSINLSMSCLSTGGFSVTHESIMGYSLAIKIIAAVGIFLGSLSFTFHFRLFTWKRTDLMKEDNQHMLFFIMLIWVGLLLIFLPGRHESIINTIFQWISAAGTCGLSAFPSFSMPSYGKFFLMFGMLIGGCLGSTAGGIKVRRIANIIKIVWDNIVILNKEEQLQTTKKKKRSTRDVNQETFLFKGEVFIRLYQSFILFCLWLATLLIGWGLLVYLLPEFEPFNVGFETISALSNAGLSVGITTITLHMGAKWCLMVLMFLGRIEIIPLLATVGAMLPVKPAFSALEKERAKKRSKRRA